MIENTTFIILFLVGVSLLALYLNSKNKKYNDEDDFDESSLTEEDLDFLKDWEAENKHTLENLKEINNAKR